MNRWRDFVKKRSSYDLPINLNDIVAAMDNISKAPYAKPVVLLGSAELSEKLDMDIYLAVATPDEAGKSFKFRGALNKLIQESEKPDNELIPVAASAGNHAQGVALAMSYLGEKGLVGEGKKFLKAKIFMPTQTPSVKVEAVKNLGGEYVETVLVGKNFSEAKEASDKYMEETFNSLLVHPFDDLQVIAGQGALMLETLKLLNMSERNSGDLEKFSNYRDFKNIEMDSLKITPDMIYVPCGGGGLTAGCAVALNELSPHTMVVAVEPTYAPSATLGLYANCPIQYPKVPKFIDESPILIATGITVQKIGEKTLDIMDKTEVFTRTATHEQLNWVTAKLHEDALPVEPAGAAGVAGLLNMTKNEIAYLRNARLARGEKGRPCIVCFISGANIDLEQQKLIDLFKKFDCKEYPIKQHTLKYDSSRGWARD